MNAKINKVCSVVIQVCNLAVVIAQAVKAAFPVKVQQKIDPSQAKLIDDFLNDD